MSREGGHWGIVMAERDTERSEEAGRWQEAREESVGKAGSLGGWGGG